MSDKGEYLIFGLFVHGMSDRIQNTLQEKDVFLKK